MYISIVLYALLVCDTFYNKKKNIDSNIIIYITGKVGHKIKCMLCLQLCL